MIRDRDGSGANAWTAGDAVFKIGNPTDLDGWVDIYSVQGVNAGSTAPVR